MQPVPGITSAFRRIPYLWYASHLDGIVHHVDGLLFHRLDPV
jgi:hypothetical protein